MVQSLEAVLTKLQKIYQIKSVELENLQKESEIKKIAFVITHLKEAEEISSFDTEKLNAFLLFIDPETNLENVALACNVVLVTENPAIKMGKRYQDALELLKGIRGIAEDYLELQKELPIKLAGCEKSLAEMEDLFNVLANKVIVEDIDKYLNILEKELFPDDIHTVLTVVAAIVIRNATILETTDVTDRPEIKFDETSSKVTLTEEQTAKLATIKDEIDNTGARYDNKKGETVTNLYLKNIESLVERNKITIDEAKDMLRTGNIFEYFLWNWINKLISKIEKSNNKKDIKEAFSQLESILPKYKECLVAHVEPVIEENELTAKELIYNVSVTNEEDSFHCDTATTETMRLLNQLKEGKDTQEFSNISKLSNELEIITGDNEFLLFKKLPNNHNFVLLNGTIDQMDNKLSQVKLESFATSDIVSAVSNIVITNDEEYKTLVSLSNQVEQIFADKGLKVVA